MTEVNSGTTNFNMLICSSIVILALAYIVYKFYSGDSTFSKQNNIKTQLKRQKNSASKDVYNEDLYGYNQNGLQPGEELAQDSDSISEASSQYTPEQFGLANQDLLSLLRLPDCLIPRLCAELPSLDIVGFQKISGSYLFEKDFCKGQTYEGEMLILQFSDGSQMQFPHGQGEIEVNKQKNLWGYKGTFQAGVLHGFAAGIAPNGNTLQGEYVMGKLQGEATQLYTNGNHQVGWFTDGQRNGTFTHYSRDGTSFQFECKDGQVVANSKVKSL